MTHEPPAATQAWKAMRALVLDNERRREVSAALGLSFIRVKALVRLADGPLPMTDLAAALSTDAPYTTVVVDDLERLGLVERQAHPADRRAKLVVLTERGAQLASRGRAILETPPPQLAALAPDDLAALARILAVP